MGHSRPLRLYFSFFSIFIVQLVDKILPTTGFKLRISGVGRNRSTNWATTSAIWKVSFDCSTDQFDQLKSRRIFCRPFISTGLESNSTPSFGFHFHVRDRRNKSGRDPNMGIGLSPGNEPYLQMTLQFCIITVSITMPLKSFNCLWTMASRFFFNSHTLHLH